MQYSYYSVADVPVPQIRDRATQTIRYDCTKCDSRFSSKMYLYHHEASHQTIFACPFRCALFSNKPDFQRHVRSHTEKRYLPCSKCNKTFTDVTEYVSHVKEHTEKPMINCPYCTAKFIHLSEHRKHVRSHLKRKFVHVYDTKTLDNEKVRVMPRKICIQQERNEMFIFEANSPVSDAVEVITGDCNRSDREECESEQPVTKSPPTSISTPSGVRKRIPKSSQMSISTQTEKVRKLKNVAVQRGYESTSNSGN